MEDVDLGKKGQGLGVITGSAGLREVMWLIRVSSFC
jgi:hypothetical protein